MIIPQGKTEFDPMKSKMDSFDDIPKEKKSNNLGLIFLILTVLVLFILLYFSISTKRYRDRKDKRTIK